MDEHSSSRRTFIRNGALLTLATPLLGRAAQGRGGKTAASVGDDAITLHWLDQQPWRLNGGVTWGVPWPQGAVAADSGFQLQDERRQALAVQSWPLAWWPDGSVKWSAHALSATDAPSATFQLRPAAAADDGGKSLAVETEQEIVVDTGLVRCRFPRQGSVLISSVVRDQRETLTAGRLVLRTQTGVDDDEVASLDDWQGETVSATVERNGPVRALITLRGAHRHRNGATRLPFVVRVYCYAGSAALRVLHTIVYDGDEQREFIRGLGLRFDVPQQAPLYDRHVRFVAANGGIFREAVRGLTGLRRDAGAAATGAQLDGKAAPPLAAFPDKLAERLHYIPAFGSYRLTQHHPDGFQIHKRTRTGYGWVLSATGQRAVGAGYFGSPDGGVAFGIRNFWQSYPACLDISAAHTERASVTLWLWSPSAEPMDMRFYHDGAGQDSYAQQREALDITYEDYEPGFASPQGVARTSEMLLEAMPATPDAPTLLEFARRVQEPPLLVASPQTYRRSGVFGPGWAPAASGGRGQALEEQLAWYFDFYRQEVEQRKWYGFWDYGDVMHTYDSQRHVWRYDVGGYAWDNSELSTDLWLWYYFLRTGRQDVFRMAEAMTRHTGEVDVYHAGRFSPLGSRHNVRHWGDSAKQLRIATAANRRFLYYLTADERIGELLSEQVEAVRTLRTVRPGRKIGQPEPKDPRYISVYFGTDWGAVAAAWLTEWERTGSAAARERLLNSMRSIAAQPHGFFTGLADFDPDSGAFAPAPAQQLFISHLSAVFGLAEICGELLQLLPDTAFERAWLDYCRLYNDPPALQAYVGQPVKPLNLVQGHARLTAFAAWHTQDKTLAKRAWREFFSGVGGIVHPDRTIRLITPPESLYPVKEAGVDSSIDKRSGSTAGTNLATNAVAQWGLTTMALLALVGDELPKR